MTAAERAAEVVWEHLCPEPGDVYAAGDGPTVEEVVAALMADPDLLRQMADEADPESAAHDSATFAACLALADVVRRFLLQNYETLTTLDSIGALSSEAGLSVLRNAIMKADAARVARVTAASADLWGADLRDADLRNADLRNANLCDANLCDANLRDADLRGANFRGADFCDADLRGADLWGADLRGANANARTVWPDGFDPEAAGVNVR